MTTETFNSESVNGRSPLPQLVLP